MKKLFPGILAMLMCFGCLTSCFKPAEDESSSSSSTGGSSSSSTPTDSSTPDENDPLYALNEAKETIHAQLIEKDVAVRKSYNVMGSFYSFIAEETFTVTCL